MFISESVYKSVYINSDEDCKHPEEYFEVLSEVESVGCYVHKTQDFTVRVNQLHNYIKYNKAVSLYSNIMYYRL